MYKESIKLVHNIICNLKKERPMAKERVKMTLLLDSDTIAILKQYASDKSGTENVSNAVRMMAKEYEKNRTNKDMQ
jgi:hypothetical protein